ncbi:hypothetical protein [Hyphomicrobium sp. CS1GBMeth3]|uniref:hypothetical protein n=1 Tax=Hyphomicrobium sp. CS1GBMeth3 TaxID=1892845 RepID=UPI0009315D72|nr:hypothetical protein [Hyphomicrobium sp. CS1GBMeth3]
MKRQLIAFGALVAASSAAQADAWMIKSSTLGCQDRETLVALDREGGGPAAPEGTPPAGCVVLDAGERLLDQPQIGSGFDDYVKLERRDGSQVFVWASAVVRDPGIGSAYEDRAVE